MQKGNINTVLLWVALIIAVVALGIGWMAYNRPQAEPVMPQIEEQINNTQKQTSQWLSDLEARMRLMALRAEITAEESYQAASEEVSQIREDLAARYENASEEAQDRWEEIDNQLGQLVNNLEEESQDAVQSLEDVIQNLRN